MNLDSNLINDQEENAIPDIFPERSFPPDIFPMEPPCSMSSNLDLAILNSQLEHLSLTVNTQSLCIEVERVKCQKMRSTIKQLRREVNNPCPEIASVKQVLRSQHQKWLIV